MTANFVYDVETMGIESNAVVLSAAIVYFDTTEDVSYDELVERSLYVKFDAREQIRAGRKIDRGTVEWWEKQSPAIRKLCFLPSPKDLSAKDGMEEIRAYIKKYGDPKKTFIWARGTLDSMVTESLSRTFGIEPLINYNSWMDVRTGIRLLKDSSNWNAYCDIPGFDKDQVDKHNPIADVCYDALMLTKGV